MWALVWAHPVRLHRGVCFVAVVVGVHGRGIAQYEGMLVCAWGRACCCLPGVPQGGHGRPPFATRGTLMKMNNVFAGTGLSAEHLHWAHTLRWWLLR